jgi:tetratricopeptide (TPR) repeat protein
VRWFCAVLLLLVTACTAQIRDDERIASDSLIQTASAAASSQPLGFKSWTGPTEENDQAVQAVREVRLDEAEALFEQSISRQPLFALAYLNLARLYLIAGEPDRARRVYQNLVSRKEFTDQELFVSGRKLYEFSRVEEGISLLEVLAQNRPTAPLLVWLGSYKLGMQDYASADSYFDGALALSRLEPEALFGRGYVRYLASDFATAADFFGRAQTAGSRENRLCVLRLTALFRSGRLEEAEKEIPGCKTPGLEAAEIKARILLVLHPLDAQNHTLSEEEAQRFEQTLPGLRLPVPQGAAADLKLEY